MRYDHWSGESWGQNLGHGDLTVSSETKCLYSVCFKEGSHDNLPITVTTKKTQLTLETPSQNVEKKILLQETSPYQWLLIFSFSFLYNKLFMWNIQRTSPWSLAVTMATVKLSSKKGAPCSSFQSRLSVTMLLEDSSRLVDFCAVYDPESRFLNFSETKNYSFALTSRLGNR